MFIIRKASQQDVTPIQRLLQAMKINHQGIVEHLSHFFVVEYPGENVKDHHALVGVIGMEVYEPYGLLRSFVLERASWNLKIGLQMIQVLLSYASSLKLSEIYLLAGGSVAFFESMGFKVISIDQLPLKVQESAHVKKNEAKGEWMVYICSPMRLH